MMGWTDIYYLSENSTNDTEVPGGKEYEDDAGI